MKLKYYLRGLGIGVLVSAFIMGVAMGDGKTLTDEEIKARAAELGMVEQGALVLSDLRNKEDAEPANADDEKKMEAAGEESTEAGSETKEPEETGELEEETGEPEETGEASQESGDESGESVNEPEENKESASTEDESAVESSTVGGAVITIVVERGDSSVSVSRDLAEAGLVADAKEYDTYLCSNGYDKKLRIGTYEIAMGSSEEEIARIITGR